MMFVHAQTLAEAKFKLKTALGVIDDSMLFDIHDELGNGANFCDPLQLITVHVSMVGFMDDATGQTHEFCNNHAVPEQLIELMQPDVQLWSDLLWLLCGLPDVDKCSYHFIYYCLLADGTTIMRSQRPGPPLDVTQ
eukprot:7125648-Ditylum_brightwellii.AAC.1